MNTRGAILGIIGLLVLGALVLIVRIESPDDPAGGASSTPAPQSNASGAAGSSAAPTEAPAPTTPSAPPEPASPARLREEVEAARADVGRAREALRVAELELDDLEREIEAVEQFVRDIEARGDDPARHAFEGMEKLNPIIERYETRLAVVLEAEQAVAAAETRLLEKEDAMVAAERQGRAQ